MKLKDKGAHLKQMHSSRQNMDLNAIKDFVASELKSLQVQYKSLNLRKYSSFFCFMCHTIVMYKLQSGSRAKCRQSFCFLSFLLPSSHLLTLYLPTKSKRKKKNNCCIFSCSIIYSSFSYHSLSFLYICFLFSHRRDDM